MESLGFKRGGPGDRQSWYVELESLADLIDLHRKVGEPIILDSDHGYLHLTIYNGYIE
jgi:hypothetical protein